MNNLIEYLKQVTDQKLAEFYCHFNVWEYPPELVEYKPMGWDALPMDAKYQMHRPVMDYIKSRIPQKELSRQWNKDRMLGVEFDIWWENREPMSELAKKILLAMHELENSKANN